jgi:CheY-like chemotaxis protein
MLRSNQTNGPQDAVSDEARRRLILLANGDPDVQREASLLAKGYGYELVCVTAASDVVRRATETRPDLIVLDVSFPDADGRDILALLKRTAATADIPALVWSGRAEDRESDRRISLGLGAEDYVEKADVVSLLRKIQRVLFRLDSAGEAVGVAS